MLDQSELLVKIGAGASVLVSMGYVMVNGMIDNRINSVKENVNTIKIAQEQRDAYTDDRMRKLYEKLESASDDLIEVRIILSRVEENVVFLSDKEKIKSLENK